MAQTQSRAGAPSSGRGVAQRLGDAALVRLRDVYATRRSTPFRLRLAVVVTVVVLLAFGAAANYGINRRATAVGDTRRAATQLLALQDIRVAIVKADAVASRSYLVGGEEPAAQRQEYLDDLENAASNVVEVGLQLDLPPSQATALASVSAALTDYSGLVEQARANNRQGFPVGTAYQRQANAVVTETIVPALRTVEAGQRSAVNAGLVRAGRAGAWLTVSGILAIASVLAGAVWLAVRFRRVLNLPLAIAVVLLLAIVIGGSAAQGAAMRRSDDAVRTSLTTADVLSQARAAAFDARSQEALTLINRGNGAANEASWQASAAIVREALERVCGSTPGSCESADAFAGYATAHKRLNDLDESGDWDGAVAASLGAAASTPFATFVDRTQTTVELDAANARSELGAATNGLGLLRLAAVAVALVAALLTLGGYGQRLREYR